MTPLENVHLAEHCTLGVGGPARFFVEACSEAAVLQALDWARGRGLRLRVLGGGSNLVVADEGIDGLVVEIALRGVHTREAHGGVELIAAAGEPWDDLVRSSVERGWAGFECLSGIPGLVGATPMQNVGAYGQEVSETVIFVRALDTSTGRIMTFENRECRFGYRDSLFRSDEPGRYVILSVGYRLRPRGPATIRYADVEKDLAARSASASGSPPSRSSGAWPSYERDADPGRRGRRAAGRDLPRLHRRARLSADRRRQRRGRARGADERATGHDPPRCPPARHERRGVLESAGRPRLRGADRGRLGRRHRDGGARMPQARRARFHPKAGHARAIGAGSGLPRALRALPPAADRASRRAPPRGARGGQAGRAHRRVERNHGRHVRGDLVNRHEGPREPATARGPGGEARVHAARRRRAHRRPGAGRPRRTRRRGVLVSRSDGPRCRSPQRARRAAATLAFPSPRAVTRQEPGRSRGE